MAARGKHTSANYLYFRVEETNFAGEGREGWGASEDRLFLFDSISSVRIFVMSFITFVILKGTCVLVVFFFPY